MSTFSAGAPALGFLHQIRYALVVLLEHEAFEVRLEALDDIDLSGPGSPTELLQLKHRAPNTKLTDASTDLWKTLRVWSTLLGDGSIDPERSLFTLVTTAIAPADSAAEFLRPGLGRNPAAALAKLRVVMASSKNDELKPCFLAFSSLDAGLQDKLLLSVYVLDESPDIESARSLLENRLAINIQRQHRGALADRVEGWWFRRCIEHLRGKVPSLSGYEAYDAIAELAEGFRRDALPIDFFGAEPGPGEKKSLEEKMFVRQLEAIGAGTGRIEKAVLDYYRAFVQRSRWARDRLLIGDEIERYEEKLRDEWERMRLALEDELIKPAAEETLQKLGRELLTWMETSAEFRIRASVTEPYVMRGSYHMLADLVPPRVWWHPEFVSRLSKIIVP